MRRPTAHQYAADGRQLKGLNVSPVGHFGYQFVAYVKVGVRFSAGHVIKMVEQAFAASFFGDPIMSARVKTYLALLPGQILFALAWLFAAFGGGAMTAPSFLKNPDALVRLERIRQWLEGGDWFAPQLARVGAVDHLVLHWTRPLDVVVAPFALMAEPFFAMSDAVLYAGVWVSLPLGLVTLSLAARLVRVCGATSNAALSLAAVFLALLPLFHLAFRPQMWPDHHGLQVLLCVAAVLLAHRVLAFQRVHAAWTLGGVQALALWVSPESLVLVAGLNASFALLWIFHGDKQVPRLALHVAGGLALGLVFALVVEYGSLNVGGALDRLSLFSLGFAAVVAVVWARIFFTQSRFTTPPGRGTSAAASAVLAGALLLVVFPDAVHGPMAATDPWFLNTWAAVYSDGFSLPLSGALILLGVALGSGGWLAHHLKQARLGALLLVPLVMGFGVLGIVSSARWVIYGEVLATALIVSAFAFAWARLATYEGLKASLLRVLAPALLMGLALVDVAAIALDDGKTDPMRRTAKAACDLDGAIAQLNHVAHARGPLLVIAHANMSPAVLYFTPHRVSAVPIHPDALAVHKSVDLLRSTRTNLDFAGAAFVFCPADLAVGVYGDAQGSLYKRLTRGEAVPGLEPLKDGAKPSNALHIFTSTR